VATATKNQDLTSFFSSDKAKHEEPKDNNSSLSSLSCPEADQQHEVPKTEASPDTKMAEIE